jgi:hypothetical protein
MSRLTWAPVSGYAVSLNRGVLYSEANVGVPWNGLTSIEETDNDELTQYYYDGVKYSDYQSLGDYEAKLNAFIYPFIFEEYEGRKPFGLSYRTHGGNDIHLLYNAVATVSDKEHETLSNSINPTDFSWSLKATPIVFPGIRPTPHFIVDASALAPDILLRLENVIYGDDTQVAHLPTLGELLALLSADVITEPIEDPFF